MVRNAKAQFERRGGFVRIFPAADSWAKYSQYLDPTNGIPTIGPVSSSYSVSTPHNYNQVLFTQLFPHVPITPPNKYERGTTNQRFCSLDRRRDASLDNTATRNSNFDEKKIK